MTYIRLNYNKLSKQHELEIHEKTSYSTFIVPKENYNSVNDCLSKMPKLPDGTIQLKNLSELEKIVFTGDNTSEEVLDEMIIKLKMAAKAIQIKHAINECEKQNQMPASRREIQKALIDSL